MKTNLYFKVAALVALLLITFGVVGPYLISAKSTFAVILGIVLIIGVALPLIWKLGKEIYIEANALIEQLKQGESNDE